MRNRSYFLQAAVALVVLSPPAVAQQSKEASPSEATPLTMMSKAERRAEELDRLFGKLRVQQVNVASRIWELWVQSDSSTADLILSQATQAMKDQKYDIALAMFDQLASFYPDYAEIYNKRATLYFIKGEYDNALKDIDKVLELEPRHFGALSGRGMVHHEKGEDDKALAAFREALAINPLMEGIKAAVKELEKKSPEI
jgi:tetratricopeptide (TPR) repeat protein